MVRQAVQDATHGVHIHTAHVQLLRVIQIIHWQVVRVIQIVQYSLTPVLRNLAHIQKVSRAVLRNGQGPKHVTAITPVLGTAIVQAVRRGAVAVAAVFPRLHATAAITRTPATHVQHANLVTIAVAEHGMRLHPSQGATSVATSPAILSMSAAPPAIRAHGNAILDITRKAVRVYLIPKLARAICLARNMVT